MNRRDHFRQALEGRPSGFRRAAAMVGDDDTIGAVFHRQRRVLSCLQSLHQHLHSGAVFQPANEIPGQRRRRVVEGYLVEPAIHRAGIELGSARRMARRALTGVGPDQPAQGLGISPGRQVDGNRHRGAPRRLGAGHHLQGDVEIRRRVELKPDRSATRFDHLLDRHRRDCGEHLQGVARLRRPGRGDLAFGIEGALRAQWAKEDRARVTGPEQLDAHV